MCTYDCQFFFLGGWDTRHKLHCKETLKHMLGTAEKGAINKKLGAYILEEY